MFLINVKMFANSTGDTSLILKMHICIFHLFYQERKSRKSNDPKRGIGVMVKQFFRVFWSTDSDLLKMGGFVGGRIVAGWNFRAGNCVRLLTFVQINSTLDSVEIGAPQQESVDINHLEVV